MKRLLVTGGCGFIFSNFIRYLLDKYNDYDIVNLDALTYAGRVENTEDFMDNSHYTFVKGNICDKTKVFDLMKDVDYVIHGAAETHVDRSIENSTDFLQTNVIGTHVLLEAARAYKVARFIHISTDEVYGSIERGAFKEIDPLRPNSPYASSKASADLLAHAYLVTYGLPVIIVRSSNNFGPFQYPEKITSLFITNALEDRPLPLYGDGLNIRDWLYVMDNCEAIDLILHRGQVGEIYNVGAGNEKTNLDVTHFILDRLGKPKDLIEFVSDRPGHDRRYALDCTKIRELGWRPRYTFEKALEKTIGWYQSHRDWWKQLKERLAREDSGHWLKRDAWSRSL